MTTRQWVGVILSIVGVIAIIMGLVDGIPILIQGSDTPVSKEALQSVLILDFGLAGAGFLVMILGFSLWRRKPGYSWRAPEAGVRSGTARETPPHEEVLPERDLRIRQLEEREADLRKALETLKNQALTQGISKELIDRRENELQAQLLDVILEKDSLIGTEE